MLRLVFILIFSCLWLSVNQAEAGILTSVAKKAAKASLAAKNAAKAANEKKQFTNSTNSGLPNSGGVGLTSLLTENGFYILNFALQSSRVAREALRERERKCQKKIKLKSSLKVFEKADVTSAQRLIFNQGETVCIRSQSKDWAWAKTGFGWIKLK